MSVPRELTVDEMRRLKIEIPNVYTLSFPNVFLIDEGDEMHQLATSGSYKPLVTDGTSGKYHLEKHHRLLVVQTPYPPLWSPVYVVWERSGPAVGSPASLNGEIYSRDPLEYQVGRIILRQIPLADINAFALIDSAIKRGAPLILNIPLPELGRAIAPKQVIVFSLKEDDHPQQEDRRRFFGLTYSIGTSAYEVRFEFDADGKGWVRIVPIDDGGL